MQLDWKSLSSDWVLLDPKCSFSPPSGQRLFELKLSHHNFIVGCKKDCWWLLAQIKSYTAQFDYVGILTNRAGTQCATNEFIKTVFLNFIHIKYKFIKFGLYLFCVCILLFVAPIFVLAFTFLLMHLGKIKAEKF